MAYQIATFSEAPAHAAGWIAGVLAAFALTIVALRHNSARHHRSIALAKAGGR